MTSIAWLFCRFFREFDWLELVVFFHTNEQNGKQCVFMVNYDSDPRRGFKVLFTWR